MESDLSEPIKHCTKYLDSDSEGDEERTHDWDELYRYPWEQNKHTLKNIFGRLNPAIKELRDKLGLFIYTKRVPSSLGWVLMKSCSGRWYFGQWNKKTRVREGVGVYADDFVIYEGYWKNGKQHWKGRDIDIDGDCYEGGWYDGERHGKGTYRKY